jgi:polyribonucleotide nucleotidyltransferase
MALEYRRELGGRPLVLEFGEVAKQANGSVLVRYGDTVVLVTATMSKEPRQGIDFFPLLVDYEERMYAVGKIPGGWGRREGRPSEEAILSARMIDRPLRPLFPDGFRNDVQVVVTVMSVDNNNSPTIAGLIGASAALTISDIPFAGPVAGIKVGLVNGEYVVNPTLEQCEQSVLDLTVAGTKDAIMMVEAGAEEVTEEQALGAIMFAHDYIKELCLLQEEIRAEIGKAKVEVPLFEPEPEMEQWVREFATERLKLALRAADKQEREQAIDTVREQLNEAYIEAFGEQIF